MQKTITAAWALAQTDLRSFLRDRTALVLTVLVPIALVTVFGWIMTYAFGGSGSMPKVRLHVADLAQSARSQDFVKALASTDMLRVVQVKSVKERIAMLEEKGTRASLDETEVKQNLEQMIRDGDASHILVIPSDFEDQLDAEQVPKLGMLRDPGRGMEGQVIQIGVMQASMANYGGSVFTDGMDRILTEQGMDPQAVGSIRSWMTDIGETIEGFYGDDEKAGEQSKERSVSPASTDGNNETPESAPKNATTSKEEDASESKSAGTPGAESEATSGMDSMMGFMQELVPVETTDIAPPNRPKQATYQVAQSVAGMTVMMLLFALTSCGAVLLKEREAGTLKRLFAQPISRNAVLLGKFFFVALVGFGQMVILLTYGELMFGVGLFRDPVTLLVLSITWVATGGAFGMFLASICRSSKQAESLASLLILMMAALGGCWFPLQMMDLPVVLEAICKSTMTFWAMTGFQSMLWNQLHWTEGKIMLALAWQWGWALVFVAGASYFFRRNYCRG